MEAGRPDLERARGGRQGLPSPLTYGRNWMRSACISQLGCRDKHAHGGLRQQKHGPHSFGGQNSKCPLLAFPL